MAQEEDAPTEERAEAPESVSFASIPGRAVRPGFHVGAWGSGILTGSSYDVKSIDKSPRAFGDDCKWYTAQPSVARKNWSEDPDRTPLGERIPVDLGSNPSAPIPLKKKGLFRGDSSQPRVGYPPACPPFPASPNKGSRAFYFCRFPSEPAQNPLGDPFSVRWTGFRTKMAYRCL